MFEIDVQEEEGVLIHIRLRGPSAHHKMQDQRDHSEKQQQMNQSTRDVEYGKSANPGDQQDNE